MAYKLYRYGGCPYCLRVEEHMAARGIEFEKVEVTPWDRSEVIRISGQPQVPVLVDEEAGRVVPDSTAIVAYLAEREPDSEES
jgi:glutathione S-transferase